MFSVGRSTGAPCSERGKPRRSRKPSFSPHKTRAVSPNAGLKVLKFLVLDAVGLQKDWQRPAREQLAEFVAEHVPADVPVRQVVALGKPFHVVVELASTGM